jgi:subfamily B ATP-binding cassette protein MsbA
MSEDESGASDGVSTRGKLQALWSVATYRPGLTAAIIALSLVAAALEGVGLSFLVPIIELAQSGGSASEAAADSGGTFGAFAQASQYIGVPFTLEYVVLGVAGVMVVRFTSSFLVAWFRAALRADYVRNVRVELFENTLRARIGYFDSRGSDEILNAVITETKHTGTVIRSAVSLIEQGLISLVYLTIAMFLAPYLTLVTAVVLGGGVYLIRNRLESGYDLGDRVAQANEAVQEAVQAGTQGIRDVKLFGLSEELFTDFRAAVDQYAESVVSIRRNEAAIDNFYQLVIAVTVFVLIYLAVTFSSLSLSGLGVFLFAMFRLGPKLSMLNHFFYRLEGNLPHLVRTQRYNEELRAQEEPNPATADLPEPIDRVRFRDVEFAYDTSEQVVDDLTFAVERGEFVAFVGPSGAGKSTVVSLLTRMYEPDDGAIEADDVPVDRVDVSEWRSRVSVVRQNPFIFDDTLQFNVTVGNRDATQAEIERACEIAQVTEFLDDLPDGYDTELGDDGVRLSGGQRQRIAIARALLEDADLLVLDEATSDLDTELEKRVHAGIEAMERDYAIVVIAHRLSTVTNADRIYAMEDGSIAEAGPHEELLEKDGQYASLYSVQT